MSENLHLYRISQDVNNGYDSYDSAVVAAESEDDARSIHPDGCADSKVPIEFAPNRNYDYITWCLQGDVKVEYIGEARDGMRRGVVCASFNAG